MNTSTVSSNYVRLGSLIIQWGNYTGNQYQTFPVPFSNTDYGITLTRLSNSYGQVAVNKKSTTGFQPVGNQSSGSWIAIGY